MAEFPQSAADYVAGLTPDDFLNGGHRSNFIPSLLAVLAFSGYGRDLAIELLALSEQVEEDAAAAAAGSGTEVTVSQIFAGAAAQYLSIRRIYEAAAPVEVAYASSVALNLNAGINFDIGALTGNLTLATPTNMLAGKSGYIALKQDATGGRTVSFSSAWKFAGDGAMLASGPNAENLISYVVRPGNVIWATIAGGFA